jgi:hypothetical protein
VRASFWILKTWRSVKLPIAAFGLDGVIARLIDFLKQRLSIDLN